MRRDPTEAHDGFRLYGTPFWSAGRSLPLDPGSAPLTVLARPVWAPAATLGPWTTAEAAAGLLACVMFHEGSTDARAWALETACAVAASAECLSLHFPKEGPWLNGVAPKRPGWGPSSTMR